MGLSLFSDDEFVQFAELSLFVSNAHKYLNTNSCVWTPAQRSILLRFFNDLIKTFENTDPVNPDLPWGSPGGGWPASNALQETFIRIRDAVARSNFYRDTYPYIVNPFAPTTALPTYPTSKQIAQFFLIVAFFWACYLSKDNSQAFLDAADYTSYVFADAAGNVDFSSASAFVAGLSRIHFAGKEITLPPNRMVILQDPAFLLTGRLVQFPREGNESKCCEINAGECMQRVNCGIYITKFVRDVICDITCNDPCRKCNLSSCRGGCYSDGTSQRTRVESEFAPEGRDAIDSGDAGQEREYRETFITIRPFINSDLLIPQLFNRVGKFGSFPWDLGLPDEFLTNREINNRQNLERENPMFDREIEPGIRGRRTQWVPCFCGSGLNSYGGREGGVRGCSSCSGGGGSYGNDREYDLGDYSGTKGDKGGKYFRTSTGVEDKGLKGFRIATDVRASTREYAEEEDLIRAYDEDGPEPQRCRTGRCKKRCTCVVAETFERPKLSIPVNAVRYIRPRTVFGLLEYIVEKLDWIGVQTIRTRDRVYRLRD